MTLRIDAKPPLRRDLAVQYFLYCRRRRALQGQFFVTPPVQALLSLSQFFNTRTE